MKVTSTTQSKVTVIINNGATLVYVEYHGVDAFAQMV